MNLYTMAFNYYRPHPKDGEGTVFTLFVSSHHDGLGPPRAGLEGVPHPRSGRGVGGLPNPRSRRGYSIQLMGVPHPRSRWLVPHARSRWAYPIQLMGW